MWWQELIFIAGIIAIFVSLLFIVSIFVKRNDIADIAWGPGIILVAGISYLLYSPTGVTAKIVLFLITLWGLRLAVRIFLRNIKKPEDYRYKLWRDTWGLWFYPRSYVQVYLLQGFLMLIVGASAILIGQKGGGEFGIITAIGVSIWCVGYFFEVVGDWQLARFVKSTPPPGSVLTTGLWKYSRHPNYFGEVTMWWGLWLIVSPLPMSYLALISPLTITFLILKVSGIPLLEKKFAGNPAFEAYKTRTSAFFPLPPRT